MAASVLGYLMGKDVGVKSRTPAPETRRPANVEVREHEEPRHGD